jgi:RNase P subunit RPR2
MSCPKCKGLVVPGRGYTKDGPYLEIYCLNCGWRPRKLKSITHPNIRRQRKWVFKKPHELKAA